MWKQDCGDVEPVGWLSIFSYPGRPFDPLNNVRFLEEEEHYAIELYELMNCDEKYSYLE